MAHSHPTAVMYLPPREAKQPTRPTGERLQLNVGMSRVSHLHVASKAKIQRQLAGMIAIHVATSINIQLVLSDIVLRAPTEAHAVL